MKSIKHLLLLLIFPLSLNAQKEMTLSLDECIQLANEQSLQAFITKNMYLASYWSYRSYKASFLPSLNYNMMPINFSSGFNTKWSQADQKYVVVPEKMFRTSGSFSLKQKVKATGGTISLNTSNRYTRTINPSDNIDVISSPFSVKYSQNINGYNQFKWQSRIDPERFKAAKQKYIENKEAISLTVINKFFRLVNAEIAVEIAERNNNVAKELYNIGKGRFEVGTITQDELLVLELQVYNSDLRYTKASQNLLKARLDLNIYLNIDKDVVINCVIPDQIHHIDIPVDKAIDYAIANNSFSNFQRIDLLTSQSKYKQAKTSRFSSDFNVTYGLNGSNLNSATDNHVLQSYQQLDTEQGLFFSFSIPILDWGETKGKIAVAKANLETTKIEIEQNRIAFEQEVNTNVLEFNLQSIQVENAAKADTIAQKGYDITYEIFKLGKLDVIKLNQARNDLTSAREAYINALQNYWSYWYTIRKQTLFDFEKNISLSEDFDAIINE